MTELTRSLIAVGVINNAQGDILLSRRPEGGLWEFPGGHCQPQESVAQALRRELAEEVDIRVKQARPLIRIHHHYPQKAVLLDVWQVETWYGQAWGREQQTVQWCTPTQLTQYPLLAANYSIVTAIRLPSYYLITPDPSEEPKFFYQLEHVLERGMRLLQLRAQHLNERDYSHCAEQVLKLCAPYAATLLVNATPEIALSVGAHGVHLSSARLNALSERPLAASLWVAASAHTLADIHQVNQLNLDFMVLSPLRVTRSHPQAAPLGWFNFFELTEQASVPVFALGGLKPQDLHAAWAHGAQGIAAIRGFWHHTDSLIS
ncbi:MAG: Nudix family hydrolase [Pseudomonadota bacterium]|nr:Nudix family hydrolase [Pseudomonadota bacterium]